MAAGKLACLPQPWIVSARCPNCRCITCCHHCSFTTNCVAINVLKPLNSSAENYLSRHGIKDCREMRSVDAALGCVAPAAVDLLNAPLLQRQVLLRSSDRVSTPLVYATSWWNRDEVNLFLKDASVPVGDMFRKQRVEVFRDIHSVYYGNSEVLEGMLGHAGPMWGREYAFWHHGKPLTVIHEVFSPVLDFYLGNSQTGRDVVLDIRTSKHASNGATVSKVPSQKHEA